MKARTGVAESFRRIVFVAEGYGPYRVPFWNELGRRVDLSLLLLGKVQRGRDWRVRLEEIDANLIALDSPQFIVKSIEWAVYLSYFRVFSALSKLAPDAVVIGGWASPGYWAARAWSLNRRVPLVFWSESHRLSTRTHESLFFNWLKRRFLLPFDSYYAFSPLSAEYLIGFGVDPSRVFLSYNLPDIGAFPRCDRAEDVSEPTLLYVGRLIENKGLLQLFEALTRVTQRPWRLLMVGAGPLEEKLRERAKQGGFLDRIEFLGYVQQEKLNDIYRRGDVLLFPTLNEVWGLVLHEAFLSGVYAVASDRAAATHALLRPGENGEMVSPFDVSALTAAIARALVRFPFDRQAIRDTVGHITIAGEVAKLVDAVHFAQTRHRQG